MSTIYSRIPKTKGRIKISFSTFGQVEISLFPQQIPKTIAYLLPRIEKWIKNQCVCEIIPQKYIAVPFNRSHEENKIQEIHSTEPPPVESHSRLKFTSRGFVAIDLNENRLYITLGQIPEWNFKKTIVGYIEGNSIFNVTRLAETMHTYVTPESVTSTNTLSPRIENVEIEVNPLSTVETSLRSEPIPSPFSVEAFTNSLSSDSFQTQQTVPSKITPPLSKLTLQKQNIAGKVSNLSNESVLSFSTFIENATSLQQNNIKMRSIHVLNKASRKRKRELEDTNVLESKESNGGSPKILKLAANEEQMLPNYDIDTRNDTNPQITTNSAHENIDEELDLQRKMIEKMNKQREELLQKRGVDKAPKTDNKSLNIQSLLSKTLKSNQDASRQVLEKNNDSRFSSNVTTKQKSFSGKQYLEEQRHRYLKKKSSTNLLEENINSLDDPLSILKKGLSRKWSSLSAKEKSSSTKKIPQQRSISKTYSDSESEDEFEVFDTKYE